MVEEKDEQEALDRVLADYECDLEHGKYVSVREKLLLKYVNRIKEKLAEKDKELERINTDNKQLYERSLDKDVTIARQLTEKTEKDKEIARLKKEIESNHGRDLYETGPLW